MAPQSIPLKRNRTYGRSLARLAAVQALFQIEFSKADGDTVMAEFLEHRFKHPHETSDVDFADADKGHFKKVVSGVLLEMTELNDLVRSILPKEWPLDRLDPEVRSILRAAAFELVSTTTPSPAIIAEYVGVADAFHDADKKRFVGGALNGLVARTRPNEPEA
ncbi:MAG: transcription antitermination factor NusB [Alphaproteobacteria bacterium]